MAIRQDGRDIPAKLAHPRARDDREPALLDDGLQPCTREGLEKKLITVLASARWNDLIADAPTQSVGSGNPAIGATSSEPSE